MSFYKFTKPDGTTEHDGHIFQYPLPKNNNSEPGDWIEAPKALDVADGKDCGPGRLHLMKIPFPTYAPWPYICNEAEPGGVLVGESEEKAGYTKCRLLRTLTDEELDNLIEQEFKKRFNMSGLYSDISWVRTYKPYQNDVDPQWLKDQLKPLCELLKRPSDIQIQSIRDQSPQNKISLGYSLTDSLGYSLTDSLGYILEYSLYSLEDSLGSSLWDSLWDSLRNSLRNSLGYSLWDSLGYSLWYSLRNSLFYYTGLKLDKKPKPELQKLIEVFKMGVTPIGWSDKKLLVIGK